MMKYLSHPNVKLTKHISNMLCGVDCILFDIIKMHDIGKVSDSFQNYIKGYCESNKGHSLISGLLYLNNMLYKFKSDLDEKKIKEITINYLAIVSHHGNLKDKYNIAQNLQNGISGNLQSLYEDIFSKKDVLDYFKLVNVNEKLIEDFAFELDYSKFNVEDYVLAKKKFSKLIFLDKFEAIFNTSFNFNPKTFDINALKKFKNKLVKDKIREEAKNKIINNYKKNNKQKIFSITAPTGIGKTLISLELALIIKEERHYKRIIYALPFTSIIDQVYNIFNTIFKNRITKHHHKANYEENNDKENNFDRMKFIVESWCEPFIVSTFYQLFYAMFSNKNSDNIKFQSLQDSVVILDEVQAIPHNFWKILKHLLFEISAQLNCTFVLMSATMPIISNDRDGKELADIKNFFQYNNRYVLKQLLIQGESYNEKLEFLASKIIEKYNEGKSVLCVVNTIKNSKLLFEKMKNYLRENVFCLNSYMISEDRRAVLEKMKSGQHNKVNNKILISTQVIEAGVDLDFDIGYREIAPLSSIIQVAGRVNREGNLSTSSVFVFDKLGRYSIYDETLENISNIVLNNELKERDLCEKEILNFIEQYFKQLDSVLGNSEKLFLEAVENFNFSKINKLLEDNFTSERDFTKSIVIGINLHELEKEYFQHKNHLTKWELKSFKEKQIQSISDKIVNIKERDIKESGVEFYFSDIFGFLGCDYLDGIYSKHTGFLIKEEKEKINDFFL